MDSISNSVPRFCFYSESHGAWSYETPIYIHMCPLSTVLTETRMVVENTMEHKWQEPVVPYSTNFAMDTCWLNSENMPPIAHYPQNHMPVYYPCEEKYVADQNIHTTGKNLDGMSPKSFPKTQRLKQRRNQKESKTLKKEQVETSQEVQQIVKSVLLASEADVDVDPETKRKMKRAERERNRYHSMTLEARQAMRKRRYAAKKQRQAEKN